MDTRTALEAIATDDALGVTWDQAGCSYLPNGAAGAICTNLAARAAELLGRGVMVGWWENPAAAINDGDGHDFLIVDDRWIVDPWVKLVESRVDRAVFDLQDPSDATLIATLYGDRTLWVVQQARADGTGFDEIPFTVPA